MSNLNSTSRLTEFPPLESEEKTDGRFSLSKFLFWRKSDGESSTSPQGAGSSSSSGPTSVPPNPATVSFGSTAEAESRADSLEAVSATIPPTTSTSIPVVRRPLVPHTPAYYRSDSNLSNRSNPSPDPLDGTASPFAFQARTLPNVLRRISNLIEMGSNNQADIKKYWMPDSVSKECYECGERFTTFRRKHHCRICGQIFCSRCCNQEIPGKIIGYSGDLRACTYCCKIVLSYLQSADLNSDLTDDLRMVQEDLQNRFGASTPDSSLGQQGSGQFGFSSEYTYRSLPRRKASLGYQEERFATSKSLEPALESVAGNVNDDKIKQLSDWVGLKALWDEMCHPVSGIDWATHRHNMIKNYHSCVVGSELVDWLLTQRKITWRGQGVQIGQMLIESGLLECVSQAEQVFMDAYALYRPSQLPLPSLHEMPEPSSARSSADLGDGRKWSDSVQDPLWVKQIKNPNSKGTDDSVSTDSKEIGASDSDERASKSRLPTSSSLYSVDLNLKNNTVSISRPKDSLDPYDTRSVSSGMSPSASNKTTPKPQRKSTTMSITTEAMTDEFLQKTLLAQKERSKDLSTPSGWHSPQELTNDSELAAFQRLCNVYIKHENDFLVQLLESMDLSSSWIDIILPIVHKVTEIVRPDVKHSDDDMDIRQYIQFKKVSGGAKEDCRIVNGIVCTKNIAHRNMRHKLKDPKILLIGSSIDYQRFENRFLSLEPLVMQEYDYLRNTVARIVALNPDLVIVEKTVARLAQEFLLDHGITLVINVKPSVMERIARCTQGVVCDSVDTHIGRPQLGLCHNYYLETFTISDGMQKTLMFFDGCAMHLGCTVLLRGGTNSELMKVKKIMSLMMFVAYNWRLERSFHIDSFSMPPSGSDDSDLLSSDESSTSDIFVEAREQFSPPIRSPSSVEHTESLSGDSGIVTVTNDASLSRNATLDTEATPKFKRLSECLSEVILSASPFITYQLPYLETEVGKSCNLRTFFPMEAYWSSRLTCDSKRLSALSLSHQLFSDCENNIINAYMHGVYINSKICMDSPIIKRKPTHGFTYKKLTSPIGADEVQSSIADFRRTGSRLQFIPQVDNQLSQAQKLRSNSSSWNTLEPDKMKGGEFSGRVDCLDPFLHQKLSVSFCSYSPLSTNFPYYCVNPWTVNMDMYGRNDISLGMFLERYCFRKSYLCPAKNCDTPMLQHVRRFAHQDACIQVILKELESPILGSGDNILMWSWCSLCKTVSPIVPMSVDAWFLSFAKYLELRFHGKLYTRRAFDSQCLHSLHHEHQQYFAQHNIVAAFKYSKVKLWEVSLPPFLIRTKHVPKSVHQLIEDIKSVAIIGSGVHANILEVLHSLKESATGLRVEDVLNGLFELLKVEKSVFRSKIEDIQMSLTSPNLQGDKNTKESEAFLWKVTDAIGFLKCNIAETIQSWNTKLDEFVQLRKKEEKQAKGTTKTDSDQALETKTQLPRIESEPKFTPKELEDSFRSTGDLADSDFLTDSKKYSDHDSMSTGYVSSSGHIDEAGVGSSGAHNLILDDSKNRVPSPVRTSFGMDFDRTKTDVDISRPVESLTASDDVTDSGKPVPEKRTSNTVKALISHLLSGVGSIQLVPSPWPSTEHSFPLMLSVMPVTVYEGEPSSVVAFTLSSNEYRKLIKDKRKMRLGSASANQEDFISGSPKDGHTDKFDPPKEIYDEKSTSVEDKESPRDSDAHIEVQFRSTSAKFYCRVYFADNFRQLREMCLVEGEEFFIRSISRCVSWVASGGKSGSTFCKTVDDRFIVKQMSRFEIQSFLDFAPHYFDYMTTSFQEKRPTVLAKIVGVFRIGFKNSQTTSASKMDILIMENLFYSRNISQKFDLKGSIRNRLATVTGKEHEDLVLLDENLLNVACENPLYIRPHTKTVLLTALTNDSRFLGAQMVMDYSLLVGFDEDKRELVVGIIDYIRTFTWDKKIETFVKSSGILGGQGKTPTVVSPDEYQTRFCEAMDRYFLLVPDRWMGLGLGVDS